ncbi:MAG: glycoside hydrolase family 5 protein [Treponema sp.]|nr:glycoside hydrolase family 5 protein [Treponema sp.]MCL2251943.1 glycoside hydrolase family 5 protein [Treponema sp.]
MNKKPPFSRGVNFSKWFEEKTFNNIDFFRYNEQDFINVKSIGADVIRLPIAFHNFLISGKSELENKLLEYLDTIIDWAEKHQIYLILDNHSFHPINPTDVNIDKILIPVWEQLARHFKNRSDYCIYEVLNEPHGIDDERWNEIQGEVIKVIRKIDKNRLIIAGGTNYNSIEKMLKVSSYDDEKIIYTFHFYDPHIFTHQGATWNKPSLVPLKDLPFPAEKNYKHEIHETFKGTWVEEALKNYENDSQFSVLSATLKKASDFAKKRNIPVFCGEFGVFMIQCPQNDRVKWYKFICSELEKLNISWTCWDYFWGFGLFNYKKNPQRQSIQDFSKGRAEFPQDLNKDVVNAMGFKI